LWNLLAAAEIIDPARKNKETAEPFASAFGGFERYSIEMIQDAVRERLERRLAEV